MNLSVMFVMSPAVLINAHRYGQANTCVQLCIWDCTRHSFGQKPIFNPWVDCLVSAFLFTKTSLMVCKSIAQLALQPLSSYLLVRLRLSIFIPFIVTCWGATLACMSAATDFKGLLIARFFVRSSSSHIYPFLLI